MLGTYWCQVGTTCSFPQTLEVLDSSGQPVPGELTVSASGDHTNATYAFRPTQPWALGETYTVTDLATAPLAPEASTFTVVPAVTPDAGRISADPELFKTQTVVDGVCCESASGRRDSCRTSYCVALEHQLGLRVVMQVALPADQRRQWLTTL